MSLIYSQIRKTLLSEADANCYRQVLVLSGTQGWQHQFLGEILKGNENSVLWLGDDAPLLFNNIPLKKAKSWLGKEKKLVVFDANTDFPPDSFAAISGIVLGGGFFILLMPQESNWNNIYGSNFGQRLIKSIKNHSVITRISQNDNEVSLAKAEIAPTETHLGEKPYLTAEQQHAVEKINDEVLRKTNNPLVLISDRGRGKSATLGIVAAKLVAKGIKNIVITAPRLSSTDIIFKHIVAMLPAAVSERGKVIGSDYIIQFVAPDQLSQQNVKVDVLMLDEAAGIPIPLLTSLLTRYAQCVFATTVHGYEGTGRGFSLRFNKVLNKYTPDWIKLHLHTPVRWPENDPLEKWTFDLLCLDAEVVDVKLLDEIEPADVEHCLYTKEQLVKDDVLLREVFALLVLAHYRTRPNDLKNLLDEENISLYVSLYQQHVVAVAMVIYEGGFTKALSTQVYRGERRPQGHLLAQSLTYHCGVEHAASFNYARVSRIAVHPELQHQGIGTALLEYIINKEKLNGRDAIGTSFGMTQELLGFWEKLNFNLARVGFKREQTSGEHAAIMLLPLTSEAKKINEEVRERFLVNISYWLEDVLKDIPLEFKNRFSSGKNSLNELSIFEKKDLQSFSDYSRNYELNISALNKFVLNNMERIHKNSFPLDYRKVLESKVVEKENWKDIGKKLNLSGQAEARKLFQQAIIYLM